ncbi:MAG: GNAT family N-acetyltransferase, partial [Sphaerochaeta sp.]
FPIDNPSFIRASLSKDTLFAGLEKQGELIALASSECDFSEGHLYAEMTDFATLPSFRKNGYASKLLGFLEEQAKLRGIKTSYTIARAISKGMNITFRKAGYVYGGRLKNNTDISGNIESMNVWYKSLVDEKEAEN